MDARTTRKRPCVVLRSLISFFCVISIPNSSQSRGYEWFDPLPACVKNVYAGAQQEQQQRQRVSLKRRYKHLVIQSEGTVNIYVPLYESINDTQCEFLWAQSRLQALPCCKIDLIPRVGPPHRLQSFHLTRKLDFKIVDCHTKEWKGFFSHQRKSVLISLRRLTRKSGGRGEKSCALLCCGEPQSRLDYFSWNEKFPFVSFVNRAAVAALRWAVINFIYNSRFASCTFDFQTSAISNRTSNQGSCHRHWRVAVMQ